ncbi:GDP-mannose 4,6-dehydratase [Nonomuraea lactucae]|uniref:GDP-mannose 4,6-dehydratase n=1 Tax=Nonomuraea lactucae TaxID=2249762 RepID=UPI0013B42A98|nr:GDP-mannose 4,6-dehydratase [Nonomuraea lactucae]
MPLLLPVLDGERDEAVRSSGDVPGQRPGVMRTVLDVVRLAFATAGLNWEDHVVIDNALVRPAEVETLCANPERARRELGWDIEAAYDWSACVGVRPAGRGRTEEAVEGLPAARRLPGPDGRELLDFKLMPGLQNVGPRSRC